MSEETAVGIAYGIDTKFTRRRRGEKDVLDHFLVWNAGEREVSVAVVAVDRGVLETVGVDSERMLLKDESLITPEKIRILVKRVLEKAEFGEKDVKTNVLVRDPEEIGIVRGILEDLLPGRKVLQTEKLPSDEAVAYGAALQASYISDVDVGVFVTWVDVTLLSLGIEVQGGGFEKVVRNGTIIPTFKRLMVATVRDNQEKVVIIVLEGDSLLASKNRALSRLELDDLPKRRKGEVDIEIMFEVDADRILTVVASEKESGERADIVVLDIEPADSIEVDQESRDDEVILSELRSKDLEGDQEFEVVIK